MMELVAMHLKRQGRYISRTLSFKGASFDEIEDAVSTEQIAQYDAAAKLWQTLYCDLVKGLDDPDGKMLSWYPRKPDPTRGHGGHGYGGFGGGMDDDDEDLEAEEGGMVTGALDSLSEYEKPLTVCFNDEDAKSQIKTYFWGAHQRFFRCAAFICEVVVASCIL
jgi:P-loop containing NTP hydrolase pore-1